MEHRVVATVVLARHVASPLDVVLTYIQCAAVKHRCRGAITTAWGNVLMSRPSLIVCTHTHTHAHTRVRAHTHTHTHTRPSYKETMCVSNGLLASDTTLLVALYASTHASLVLKIHKLQT